VSDTDRPADRLRRETSQTRRAGFVSGAGLLILAVLLLAVAAILLGANQRELSDSVQAVEHTEQVLRQASDLDIALVDTESASRAYILTDNTDYLTAYQNARGMVDKLIDRLAKLVADNPDQVSGIEAIRPLLQRRLARTDAAIAVDPSQRPKLFAPENVEAAQALRRDIRGRLDSFRANELGLLKLRQAHADHSMTVSAALAAATALFGAVVAGLGIFLLLRERGRNRIRELQAELHHLSRVTTIGQTASMLAHEINQPLTATINYLEALRRMISMPATPPEKIVDTLQKASAQVRRAGDIVGRLRRFVGKQEAGRSPEDVAPMIADAVSLLGHLGDRVQIQTEIKADLPPVLVDRIQIQQVLVNLARNAIEAMANAERRDLAVGAILHDPKLVRISVSDTGAGMTPEVAKQLFKPFVSTKPEGMGVGLSICRAIILEHGGRIWSEPNAGRGTTFHFTMPVADPPAT
jgi:signal transduction histidine kinase